jgi:hypothetical protein
MPMPWCDRLTTGLAHVGRGDLEIGKTTAFLAAHTALGGVMESWV